VVGGKLVAKDVGEREILKALDTPKEAAIVVSPIGQQGFVLGRGNLQISPAVLRRVGVGNVLVSTPAKLVRTPLLRVDTGEAALDAEFTAKEYLFVLVGYRAREWGPGRSLACKSGRLPCNAQRKALCSGPPSPC